MEAINSARQRVWNEQPRGFLSHAFIDTDGTIAGTLESAKEALGFPTKGSRGYAPLIISLANPESFRGSIWLIGLAMWSVMKDACLG